MDTQAPTAALHLLVVDDEPNVRKMLSISLAADGHAVTAVANVRDALSEVARRPFDLAFIDLRLGTDTGLDLVPRVLAESPWTRVVVITAHASVDGYLRSERGPRNLELETYVHPGGHDVPPEVPKLVVEFFQRHTLSGG